MECKECKVELKQLDETTEGDKLMYCPKCEERTILSYGKKGETKKLLLT